jgi:uncharacterized OsmC-like protein
MPEKPYSDKEKTILEKSAESCPVGRSLSDQLSIDLQLIWAS